MNRHLIFVADVNSTHTELSVFTITPAHERLEGSESLKDPGSAQDVSYFQMENSGGESCITTVLILNVNNFAERHPSSNHTFPNPFPSAYYQAVTIIIHRPGDGYVDVEAVVFHLAC